MAEPLVSVVMATWNRAALLREAIASVQRQTYTRWELLVVDDGSTDETPAVLADLGDRRVRATRLEHGANPARARNVGLREARGELVAFLDDDDCWMPRKLAVQVPALRAGPARWSYAALTRVDAAGRTLSGDGIRPWRPHEGWILPALLTIDAIVAMPTVLAERALLEEAGGFDEHFRYCEDYELWFRLAQLAPAVAVAEPLARVRVHSRTHTAGREPVHLAWAAVYEKTARGVTPALARLCRRERARHLASAARHAASRGDRREAFRRLRAGFADFAHDRYWWRSLARVLWPA